MENIVLRHPAVCDVTVAMAPTSSSYRAQVVLNRGCSDVPSNQLKNSSTVSYGFSLGCTELITISFPKKETRIKFYRMVKSPLHSSWSQIEKILVLCWVSGILVPLQLLRIIWLFKHLIFVGRLCVTSEPIGGGGARPRHLSVCQGKSAAP